MRKFALFVVDFATDVFCCQCLFTFSKRR